MCFICLYVFGLHKNINLYFKLKEDHILVCQVWTHVAAFKNTMLVFLFLLNHIEAVEKLSAQFLILTEWASAAEYWLHGNTLNCLLFSKPDFRLKDLVWCLQLMTGCAVLEWQGGEFSKRIGEVERQSWKLVKMTLFIATLKIWRSKSQCTFMSSILIFWSATGILKATSSLSD